MGDCNVTINRQTLFDAARDLLREYDEAHARGEEMPYPHVAEAIVRRFEQEDRHLRAAINSAQMPAFVAALHTLAGRVHESAGSEHIEESK